MTFLKLTTNLGIINDYISQPNIGQPAPTPANKITTEHMTAMLTSIYDQYCILHFYLL